MVTSVSKKSTTVTAIMPKSSWFILWGPWMLNSLWKLSNSCSDILDWIKDVDRRMPKQQNIVTTCLIETMTMASNCRRMTSFYWASSLTASSHVYLFPPPLPPICQFPFSFIIFTSFVSFRLSCPFRLQHRQKRHGPSSRGLRSGPRRPLRVGVSPAHVGQGGEAPAQDGGGSPPTALPASNRPLLRARV